MFECILLSEPKILCIFFPDQIIEKATIAAVRSVLPMAARLGRKRKSSELTDLRDIITRKSEQSDRCNIRSFILSV